MNTRKFDNAYYDWAVNQLAYDWWDWKYEELTKDFDDIGVDIDDDIEFDDYRLTVEGSVRNAKLFVTTIGYTSDLFIFNEAMVNPNNITINIKRNGVHTAHYLWDENNFTQGLFTQMLEDEYDEAMGAADWASLESAVWDKVKDMCSDAHRELMDYQEAATSEEEFKRWIKECPEEAKEIYGLRGKRERKAKSPV